MSWDNNENNNINGYNQPINPYEQPQNQYQQPIQNYDTQYPSALEPTYNSYEQPQNHYQQPTQNYEGSTMTTSDTNYENSTHHSGAMDNLSSVNTSPTPNGSSFWQSFSLLSGLQNIMGQNQQNQAQTAQRIANIRQAELNDTISSQQEETVKLRSEVEELYGEIARLRQQINSLNDLLNQPSNIIAQYHQGFSETYIKDKEILANWMVWQKAFQEVAIQLGSELGLSQQEVIEKAKANYSLVLTNSNDPSHDTNSADDFFNLFREKLLENFAPKTKEEVSERIKKTTQSFSESNNASTNRSQNNPI